MASDVEEQKKKARPAGPNPIVRSNTFIRWSLLPALLAGVAVPLAIRVWRWEYPDAAELAAGTSQALAGAALPVITVLGMLAYLQPSRSVRFLRWTRRRREAVAESLEQAREWTPPAVLDWAVIAGVGYFTGRALIELFDPWLDEIAPAPDTGIAWGLCGFFAVSLGWLIGAAVSAYRAPDRRRRFPVRPVIGLALLAVLSALAVWLLR